MHWIHTAWESLILGILVTRVLAHPFNNTTGEECYTSSDCTLDQICVEQKCIDPCEGACGPYTVCLVKDRQPMCSCKPGYEGHPFNECKPRKDLECTKDSQCSLDKACMNHKCVDPCQDTCGLNSDCMVINHRHMCACKNGFFYNPISGCLPVSVPQCQVDKHCAKKLACRQQQCLDPCEEGICGNNTICHVTNHTPACACLPGYSGNPFEECSKHCMIEKGLKKSKKFYTSDYKRDWFGALEDCNIRDMKLATVNNEEEWNFLLNSYSDPVWIGGHDLGRTGNFLWVTTGGRLSFTKWREGEPDGDDYHCIVSTTEKVWISQNCEINYNFACEFF